MKQSFSNPPYNIRELCESQFDLSATKPIFTFKDVIYNPDKADITADLLVHEKVHAKQQGEGPVKWWLRYSEERDFRLNQEGEAYRLQYLFAKTRIRDRNDLDKYVRALARDLSSPMYGSMCSYQDALARIKV